MFLQKFSRLYCFISHSISSGDESQSSDACDCYPMSSNVGTSHILCNSDPENSFGKVMSSSFEVFSQLSSHPEHCLRVLPHC